jgi:hypothetical protein
VSDAAWQYDASTLKTHFEYGAWDGEKMQGCVCDAGWTGYDCSLAQCPINIDIYNTGAEEQTFRTSAIHLNEVQRLSFGVSSPANSVREVQRFFIAYANTVTEFPIGRFRLAIDTRYAVSVRGPGTGYTNECAFCSHDAADRGIFTTSNIEVARSGTTTDRAAMTSANVKAALEALPPIDTVHVNGVHETVRYHGYEFLVTFTGPQVRGTIPLLQVQEVNTQNAIPLTVAERAVRGSHLTGAVIFSYDNSASFQRKDLPYIASATTSHADCALLYPSQFPEVTGNCLGINSSPSKVQRILELMPNVDDVEVSFEYSSEAGIEWVVTFVAGVYNQGDIAPFTFPSSTTDLVAVQDGSASPLGSPTYASTAVQNGRFINPLSKFQLIASLDGEISTFEFTAEESESAMQTAIERWPVAGIETYRIGAVRVTRRVPTTSPETSDDYMGEYEWTVTFLDIPAGLEPLQLDDVAIAGEQLDAAPSDAGRGGAVMLFGSQTRQAETHILRSMVQPKVEVQRLTLAPVAASEDVDEVFQIDITSQDTTFAQGYMRLQFDSSGTNCPLCTVKALHEHSGVGGDFFQLPGWSDLLPVDFDHGNAAHISALEDFAAESLAVALESLPNIGISNIQVSASYTSAAGPTAPFVSRFLITFSGPDVGGDIADTALSSLLYDGLKLKNARRVWAQRFNQHHEEKILDSALAVTVSSVIDGSLYAGNLALTYDPHDVTENHPAITGTSVTTNNIDLGALMTTGTFNHAALSAAVVAAMPQLDTIAVDLRFNGGPGFVALLTFSSINPNGVSIGVTNRGTRKRMECLAASVQVYQGLLEGTSGILAGTPACVVHDGTDRRLPISDTANCFECQKGNYLLGNWQLHVVFKEFRKKSSDLAWDASAADVRTSIIGLFPDARELQTVEVTRQPFFAHGQLYNAATFGEFQWNISLPFSVQGLITIAAEPTTLTGSLSDPAPGGAGATFLQTIKIGGRPPAQVDEIQLLECSCGIAGCSGGFKLSLLGFQTAFISHSTSAAQLRSLLVAAFASHPGQTTISDVEVEILPTTSSSVCHAGAHVTTRVRFENWLTDVQPLFIEVADPSAMTLSASSGVIRFRIKATDGSKGAAGFTARDGTKRGQPCSGRGVCTAGSLTQPSKCDCVPDPAGSGGATLYAGKDCATRAALPSTCPQVAGVDCNGHGQCSGSPSFYCSCEDAYSGTACQDLTCPKAHAWFDEAVGDDAAHEVVECAGIGTCSETGRCSCASSFSFGKACEKLRCPLGDKTCGGHGSCITMADFGRYGVDKDTLQGGTSYYEGPWDANQVTGCYCGAGRLSYVGPYEHSYVQVAGWRCSNKACPASTDPKTSKPNAWGLLGHEVQSITCTGTAASGFVRFSYANYSTGWLDADAPPSERSRSLSQSTLSVQAALSALPSLHGVVVTGNSGKLCAAGGAELFVTFRGNHGKIQILRAESNGTLVAPVVAVSKQNTLTAYECSRRGVCDHNTGKCVCEPGFGSSDGNLTSGSLGDCGHYDVDYKSSFIHTATEQTYSIPTIGRHTQLSGFMFVDTSTNSLAGILAQDAAKNAADSLQALAKKF